MFRAYATAFCLLFPMTAIAGENAFNADMDHASISTVITEFEKVCFPFISHETELTAEQDREVFQSRMVEAGYAFDDEKEWKQQTQYGEVPAPMMYCPGQPTYERQTEPRVEGKFIVFPPRDKIIKSKDPITSQTCEISGPAFLRPLRTEHYTRQIYTKILDSPILVTLLWQDMSNLPDISNKNKPYKIYRNHYSPSKGFKVRTSFPPASSCGVNIHDENLTVGMIETTIIAHDFDWEKHEVKDSQTKEVLPDAHNWTQCTKQDEENYVYSINLSQGTLSMNVKTLQDDQAAPGYNCKPSDEKSG